MPPELTATEPPLKRNAHGRIIKSFVTDAALQAKNGSMGPNALYDEFIRRNSSRDICSLLADYISSCNANIQIQILKRLLSRLCQHPLSSNTNSIDSQIDLLYAIIDKKLPYREYIQHVISQSSRFYVLKAVFSRLGQNDPSVLGKLSVTLFAILETTTSMRVSIQLVLAFIREQLESLEAGVNTTSTITTDLCTSLFFRFTLRMQQAYGSFFIDELVRDLTIVDNVDQEADTRDPVEHTLSSSSSSSSCKTIITTLQFFVNKLSQSHNNANSSTARGAWTDYLVFCSCLCQALDKTVPQSHTILKSLLCLDETPDIISIMHEHLITLTTRSNSLTRHGLAYIEALCWSIRAYTIIHGHDYRFFALFSSAIETLGNKLSNKNQTFPIHWVRPICFLLNSFLKIAPIAEPFREQVYRFLERRCAIILESCLFPKSDYPSDVYLHLTNVFPSLALLFPEILFNAFLLILKHRHRPTHNLGSNKTLLSIILLSLRRFSIAKTQSLSKYVLLQLLQSLEQLIVMLSQTDYGFLTLLHDVHQSIICVAKLMPGVVYVLATECIMPKFRQHLCSSEFAQYLGLLSIYTRSLVEIMKLKHETVDGINELFERAFVLIASQFQLLGPDTDALQFSIVCDLLVDVMNSGITLSYTQIRPLVSFLPTICTQYHEHMKFAQLKADKRDVYNYLCAMYKAIETICSQAHKQLSTSKLHSSLEECMGPDILRCLYLIPDVLENVNARTIEQSVTGAIVQASRVCPPHDIFRVLFSGEGRVSRSTRLALCRSAALISLTVGVGTALPSLVVQYGAIPDKIVKLSILRVISYSFDRLSLTNTHVLSGSSCIDECETRCTTYMALLEGTVGIASHALAERDGSIRLMGMRVTESMMLSCAPIQQGSPLLNHLVSMSFPNILDLCDRTLSDAFQRLFEALYYRFGAGSASSFLFPGLFHVAQRVRQAYKLVYDSAKLYNGLIIDLFAPSMNELLTPMPACLQASNKSYSPRPSVSVLEWTIGRKQCLDYDCEELFIRI